jgi:hypothetical protein
MRYLTVGSCLKQEEPYMLDFLTYHRRVGVEHFVFYDREFTQLSQLLSNEPDVEVFHFPESTVNVHAQAWADLIQYNTNKTKWLALIDADQALVPVKYKNVKDVLAGYETFASLQCNWHTFGSSGHLNKEPGSVYERFLKRAPSNHIINRATQFICQPHRTLPIKTHDPHHPRLPDSEVSVNTNRNVVQGPFNSPPLHDVLWVAHYSNKSREEWAIKNSKGRADIFGDKMPFTMFEEQDDYCNSEYEGRVLELWNT